MSAELQAVLVQMVLPIVALLAVFYFLLLRPQQKQQKKIREMLAGLKVGDRVKTIGGIYGRIVKIKDEDYITIEVGPDKVNLVFDRKAIGSVENVDVENEM
ncbi:MAG: preprotein translocase subunit YajC [Christensenellales bacterium]|jgi:preprotein translocase subunit YajC